MLSRRIFVAKHLLQNSVEDIGLIPVSVFFASTAYGYNQNRGN